MTRGEKDKAWRAIIDEVEVYCETDRECIGALANMVLHLRIANEELSRAPQRTGGIMTREEAIREATALSQTGKVYLFETTSIEDGETVYSSYSIHLDNSLSAASSMQSWERCLAYLRSDEIEQKKAEKLAALRAEIAALEGKLPPGEPDPRD